MRKSTEEITRETIGFTEMIRRNNSSALSLYLKVPYTVFVCLLVPVYWIAYGPANFLWASNIALFVILVSIWTGNRLLPSMMALGVLLPETGWMFDFTVRLVFGEDAIPLAGTRYMFNPDIPLWVRGLSLYHFVLPAILIWLLYRLGYQRRALYWQTLVAWVVLPVSYLVGEPPASINWVNGFGPEPQTAMPGPLFVALLMVLAPVALYLPTHLLLSRLFPDSHDRSAGVGPE
jgi:hypothetical protein